MSEKTKIIEGKNLEGEPRKYTFTLMNAEQGGKIFHENSSIIKDAWKIVAPFYEKGNLDITFLDIIDVISELFTWDKVKELAACMLANYKAEIDGEEFTADATGISEYTAGKPFEIYVALFYAAVLNYPPYLGFLLEAPEKGASDTTQDSTEQAIKQKTTA